MSADDWFDTFIDCPDIDWEEECACCGKLFPISKMVIEEGDRWECLACWEICEAAEREAERRAKEQKDEQS